MNMQLLNKYSKNLEDILNKIIDHKIAIGHIDFKDQLNISASVLSNILYILETKDLKSLDLYALSDFKCENKDLFKKIIPDNICRILYCKINDEIFIKDLYIQNFGSVKILAKPDAFFDNFPVEVKSVSSKILNSKKYKFLERYGNYQAKIYGYILDKEISYFIMSVYNKDNLKIINYKVKKVDVNIEEIDKKVKNILKEIILPILEKS
ncbi:MAG: hypothetical protein QXQ19_01235 [Candidatus Aenigmatarchaeota archaeon]